MRALDPVRAKAVEMRQILGGSSERLLQQLEHRLWNQHAIEMVPVDGKAFLRGSRAEVVPAEGCLYYDKRLNERPEKLLEVVAHEFAHIVLHHHSFGVIAEDLIRGSVFLDTGAPALSRYSPRSREEAQASAFAAELICPAREVFERWRTDPRNSLRTLTSEYHATPSLVRLQLAEGLYLYVVETAVAQSEPPEERDPTHEQERAATFCGLPVLVDAGPGTGKTKTLVRRIIFLIREKSVAPENILVLTFSNEAAAELEERIRRSLGEEIASRLRTLTFHGFGVMTLNALGHHIGLEVDFSILDEICQEELLSEILGTVDCEALLDIRDPNRTAAEVVRHINYLKDRLIGPTELKAAIDSWQPQPGERDEYFRSQALHRLFEAYEHSKKTRNQLDFADLILVPHQILSGSDEIRSGIRREFQWVLVDEYQDVSRSTALLLQLICGEHNPPWVVGDARQAIYRFRGAEPENVRRFGEDFPGAKTFELSDNYRSAPEIIALINRLAASLEGLSQDSPIPERWRPGSKIAALSDTPVVLAVANSDAAEREGILRVVEGWLEKGVPAEQIAVLARRNVDVRNIAIELKEHGIRAITSGLLTAEGAGGDLSGVLTAVDHEQALPRLVYALWRHCAPPEELNDASRQLLAANIDTEQMPQWSGPPIVREVAAEAWRVLQELHKLRHSGDGWMVLCDFLFFLTPYVRNLIEHQKEAASSVQLEEVISSLALAANYRFSHLHVRPRWSRLGLAERMRDLVTQPVPGLVPPQPHAEAVRVMTCHASKGLEFPCVVVAGQSLADIPPQKPCLPPIFRPNPEDDSLQAESLLFVGVSRAQSAAVISYAQSASGGQRSRPRRFPSLLIKLHYSGAVPVHEWTTPKPATEEIEIGRIWGGEPPSELSLYSLGSRTCRVKMYLEEQLGARFRGRLRPLYPEFTKRVRRMLSRVMQLHLQNRKALSGSEAGQILEEEWPANLYAEHPHIALYRPRASKWMQIFAQTLTSNAFREGTAYEEAFEWVDSIGVSRTVKLQLIGQFRDAIGDRVVLAMQLRVPNDSGSSVNWSELKDYQRLPFVLLHERHGNVRPMVFFGEQGETRSFRWRHGSPDQAIRDDSARARRAFEGLLTGSFDAIISDWICDGCSCRTICPWWIGAATGKQIDPPAS